MSYGFDYKAHKTFHTDSLKNISIPYLGDYRTLKNGIVVKWVDMPKMRDEMEVDLALGGNSCAYEWMDKKEIQLGDMPLDNTLEANKILVHEHTERNQMLYLKLKYEPAHKFANKIEWFCRHHPEYIEEILAIPDDKNAREICQKIMRENKEPTRDFVQLYMDYMLDSIAIGLPRNKASDIALYRIRDEFGLDELPFVLHKYL